MKKIILSDKLREMQKKGAVIRYKDGRDLTEPQRPEIKTNKIQEGLMKTISSMAEEIQDKIEKHMSDTGDVMANRTIEENLSKIGKHMADEMKGMVKTHLSNVASEMSGSLKHMESALKDMESAMKNFMKITNDSDVKIESLKKTVSANLLAIVETNKMINEFKSFPDEIKKELNNKPEEKLKEFDAFVTKRDGEGKAKKIRIKQIQ